TLGVDFLKNSFGNAGDDVRMVLNEMDNAARRADAVILGMVEFSSYNKRDVKDHDLSHIVEQSLRSVEGEIKHHSIKLVKDLAPDLPPVRLDLKTVKHVFINLLMSAIQAMSGGGTLTVSTCLKQLSQTRAGAAGQRAGWRRAVPASWPRVKTVVEGLSAADSATNPSE